MRKIGRVREVWRYPVSSLGGEALASITVSPEGIEGDRRFALFDPDTGLAAAPEKETRWRPALFITASQPPTGLPVLRFADGAEHALDDSALPDRLAEHFGFPAAIGLVGSGDYRFPVVSNRYAPAPLHLLTTASVSALAAVTGLPPLDARRFRPSVLIETEDDEGFIENDWVGHMVRIGEADIRVTEASRRCGMTLVAQPGMAEDPDVLRSIMRHNKRNLGVYATPAAPVTLSVGDPVYAEI
ncbi:MAG: MOSC domain-containing protein [Alphaproteobacteria bacterium]|nr:MOSC domain-containing protein [Alphaproteobacteria bacterium]MBU0830867.1 MOSC domain-containing protein [Alphaproteobacteria bacterium]MBU1763540.1 MOSC domain-containing protein [Alphaproteobacteria bacterium]MDM7982294.1 MOSC domain-containing protein [Rhizobium sp.]MDM8014720.1 MOSC domain-containing protein [Rhizobium sp.]